jgi:hypothetical protein
MGPAFFCTAVKTHKIPAQGHANKERTMSIAREEDIKRWTSKHRAALVMEIIQSKTSITKDFCAIDVCPAENVEWADEAKRGMENAIRAKH